MALCYVLLLNLLLTLAPTAIAQSFSNNGQFFTKGLAISDAPAPDSPQHAGSDIVIAVDLSGDGKISQDAFTSNSTSPTHYISLNIYLTSSTTNFTVSNGSAFLSQEPGSTVKHLNWPIPNCVPSGSYNLTYYETALINNQIYIALQEFFSITPLPITMQNANPSSDNSQCNAVSNTVQSQPQQDSAPAINPYADPNSPLDSGKTPGAPGVPTITISSPGLPSVWSIETSGAPTATVTVTAATTATLVVVSSKTLTETLPGQTNLITTT
ncbi:hypothetical protein SCHPADRAFT_884609 [Schizopora paradoxa]|uniref:EF-hand domain-containing protein n=1 Tax=Schizopora paradoxa TaxID=27342 RepID=A0A0H2S8K8_9AGAM|nr:hypothetical protein SCHPADRAFT_884609 [Schizopora paradoxa]